MDEKFNTELARHKQNTVCSKSIHLRVFSIKCLLTETIYSSLFIQLTMNIRRCGMSAYETTFHNLP